MEDAVSKTMSFGLLLYLTFCCGDDWQETLNPDGGWSCGVHGVAGAGNGSEIFTPETLRAAAKQSIRCHVVPVRPRRATKRHLREQDERPMKRKVSRLLESFNEIKKFNLMLPESTSKDILEDPLKSVAHTGRWKIKSAYGDIGFTYREDEAVAYVAFWMPAVCSALYWVLSEVS